MSIRKCLFWDGVYNVDPAGALIGATEDNIYDDASSRRSLQCNERSLVAPDPGAAGPPAIVYAGLGGAAAAPVATVVPPAVSVIISRRSNPWYKYRNDRKERKSEFLPTSFDPYEQVLTIPIRIREFPSVKALMLRVFRPDPANDVLVYQEVIKGADLRRLHDYSEAVHGTGTLVETSAERQARQYNYWGIEDFANAFHGGGDAGPGYRIEVWISVVEAQFDACSGAVHPVVDNARASRVQCCQTQADLDGGQSPVGVISVRALDAIETKANPTGTPALFSWTRDYARIFRLVRNDIKFMECLGRLDTEALAAGPAAAVDYRDILRGFERQCYFSEARIKALGILTGDQFNALSANAHMLDDLGAGPTHGAPTHRLHVFAVCNLITHDFADGANPAAWPAPLAGAAPQWNHSPLELISELGRSFAIDAALSTGFPPGNRSCSTLWKHLFDDGLPSLGSVDEAADKRGYFSPDVLIGRAINLNIGRENLLAADGVTARARDHTPLFEAWQAAHEPALAGADLAALGFSADTIAAAPILDQFYTDYIAALAAPGPPDFAAIYGPVFTHFETSLDLANSPLPEFGALMYRDFLEQYFGCLASGKYVKANPAAWVPQTVGGQPAFTAPAGWAGLTSPWQFVQSKDGHLLRLRVVFADTRKRPGDTQRYQYFNPLPAAPVGAAGAGGVAPPPAAPQPTDAHGNFVEARCVYDAADTAGIYNQASCDAARADSRLQYRP